MMNISCKSGDVPETVCEAVNGEEGWLKVGLESGITTSQHHRGLPWIEIATNNNNFGPRLRMPLL